MGYTGVPWEGVALPNPPAGRGLGARASGLHPQGNGETRFPRIRARKGNCSHLE